MKIRLEFNDSSTARVQRFIKPQNDPMYVNDNSMLFLSGVIKVCVRVFLMLKAF